MMAGRGISSALTMCQHWEHWCTCSHRVVELNIDIAIVLAVCVRAASEGWNQKAKKVLGEDGIRSFFPLFERQKIE